MKDRKTNKINSEFEYELAVAKVEELWEAAPGSTDHIIKLMLLDMIHEYEGQTEVEDGISRPPED